MSIEIGAIIDGKYRVDKKLGEGGMGVVLAVTHVKLGKRYAIKLVKELAMQLGGVAERFAREARAASQLRSEHVGVVTDVGDLATGQPYMVMEMLEGEDLGRMLERGPLPVELAVEYVLQGCEAIAEAHSLGMVHRDIKPTNLFLTRRRDGSPLVKVLDFGIATAAQGEVSGLTETHAVMGSPQFMSPEQVRSAKTVDARSDIWSIAVTLYQLISKRLPFDGVTFTQLAIQIATEDHLPLGTVLAGAPPELAAIIDRCLQKRPEHRLQTIAELAFALAPFTQHGAVAAQRVAFALGPALSASQPVAREVSPTGATILTTGGHSTPPYIPPLSQPNHPSANVSIPATYGAIEATAIPAMQPPLALSTPPAREPHAAPSSTTLGGSASSLATPPVAKRSYALPIAIGSLLAVGAGIAIVIAATAKSPPLQVAATGSGSQSSSPSAIDAAVAVPAIVGDAGVELDARVDTPDDPPDPGPDEDARLAKIVLELRKAIKGQNYKLAQRTLARIPKARPIFARAEKEFSRFEAALLAKYEQRLDRDRMSDRTCKAWNKSLRDIGDEMGLAVERRLRDKIPCSNEAIALPSHGCNATQALVEGQQMQTRGQWAGATSKFDESYRCQPSPVAARQAFMAACQSRNEVIAKKYYPLILDKKLANICEGTGTAYTDTPKPPPQQKVPTQKAPPPPGEATAD